MALLPGDRPHVAIIRASACDERGNMSFEQEGAYLGAMELALAAHNNGGIVIAQVRSIVENETLKPHQVRVPGILVDYIVEAPDQWQTTQTPYDPAISGEVFKPISSFSLMDFGTGKAIARRVAQELRQGWAVNLGFGVSANVPRIFIEEGLHGQATWVIEQGAVGGVPLLEFQFGCASNAEAFVPSAYQFTYFQAAGFDCSLLSFLQIDRHGSVNVSKLGVRPHVTAGAGGFVDITSRARKIVYSGFFNAGAKMEIVDGKLKIEKEGKVRKLVKEVEQVSFSGRRGVSQGQDVTYVTERCVMKLTPEGIVRHRDRTGRRSPVEHPRPVGIPADRLAATQGNGQAPVPAWQDGAGARMADTGDDRIRLQLRGAACHHPHRAAGKAQCARL